MVVCLFVCFGLFRFFNFSKLGGFLQFSHCRLSRRCKERITNSLPSLSAGTFVTFSFAWRFKLWFVNLFWRPKKDVLIKGSKKERWCFYPIPVSSHPDESGIKRSGCHNLIELLSFSPPIWLKCLFLLQSKTLSFNQVVAGTPFYPYCFRDMSDIIISNAIIRLYDELMTNWNIMICAMFKKRPVPKKSLVLFSMLRSPLFRQFFLLSFQQETVCWGFWQKNVWLLSAM